MGHFNKHSNTMVEMSEEIDRVLDMLRDEEIEPNLEEIDTKLQDISSILYDEA